MEVYHGTGENNTDTRTRRGRNHAVRSVEGECRCSVQSEYEHHDGPLTAVMVPYARHRSKELESISQETRGRYDVQVIPDLWWKRLLKRLLKLQRLELKPALNEVSCSRLLVSGHRRIEELDSQRKLRRSR